MKVYSFFGKTGSIFQKHRSLCGALAAVNGDESRVYVHVDGIPNPWFVHPVENGKINRKKIIKPGELKKRKFKTKMGVINV